MIIARSPLRITLGGGGTDLPTYYRRHGGFVIAAAIDKYVYVTVTRPFVPGIYLKYSKLEKVDTADEVHHPIRTEENDPHMLENLPYVKELSMRSLCVLERGDRRALGELMHEHWEHKKRRSPEMSNPQIDEWYELARKNGALGGKLVGAGGGGFLMFYSEDHRRLRAAMAGAGLEEVRFRFDFEGTKVLLA